MLGFGVMGQYALGELPVGTIVCGTAGCIVVAAHSSTRPPLFIPSQDGYPSQLWEGVMPDPGG